jgi:protein arginine kinase activator
MHCQNCHNNSATVRYSEVVDGEVQELHLCKQCLNNKQENKETGFDFSKPNPFMHPSMVSDRPPSVKKAANCPVCGTSLQSMLATATVGCSTCYGTFSNQLESVLKPMHISLVHRGKVPRLDDVRARARVDLQTKRTLLKSALGLEDYEEAASLRDQIQALETGLSSSEKGHD